jgi:4-diphosphocytidyl-2-C-methyl-D-erythritol kinase
MKKTRIKAFGKINLYFELVNKRQDGYHDIKSIMQNIDLYDELTIEESVKGIEIDSNIKSIPKDHKNTVYKAAEIIKELFGIDKGIKIFINKRIPHEAGLGGGSSDAAALIEALDKMWDLNMKEEFKHKIAGKIGTDVHFFLENGTSYVTGKGDITEKIKYFTWNNILLVKPKISISTPYVYSKVKKEDLSYDNTNNILELYKRSKEKEIIPYFKNDLEKIVFEEFKEVEKIKIAMIKNKARLSLMSGSGSSVFGLFDNETDMVECKKIMGKKYKRIYITKSNEKGYDYEG